MKAITLKLWISNQVGNDSDCTDEYLEAAVAAVPALRDSRRREIAFVVRDASGEYVSDGGRRTPASDEAREYATREEADAACERATDRVLVREIE